MMHLQPQVGQKGELSVSNFQSAVSALLRTCHVGQGRQHHDWLSSLPKPVEDTAREALELVRGDSFPRALSDELPCSRNEAHSR